MFLNLSLNQVEKALEWLASPPLAPLPQGLEHLSQQEWFLLSRLLESLQEEQKRHLLH